MSSFRGALMACLGILALAAPAVLAHGGGSINYISKVTSVVPAATGVKVEVLERDDRLQLSNHSRSTVVVEGYNEEAYLRLRPDGTVEANRHSPALYLNEDRYADVKVPKSARAKARPSWKVIDRDGRVDWHDHRVHWMSKTRPGKVRDPDARTKIFDWAVPIRVGARPGKITGELFWVPRPGESLPVAAVAGLGALIIAGGALVFFVRRRRRIAPHRGDEGEAW